MDYITLPTDIQEINNLLKEHFGIDSDGGGPIWRISWSNDQYEWRLTDTTPGGVSLLWPEIMELPKYTWVKNLWVLERLVLVPEFQQAEIPKSKKSYELLWSFKDRYGGYLRPTFEACKFIVDTVYAAQGKSSLRKYCDPEDSKTPLQAKSDRVDKLMEELFGDESDLKLKTVTGEAVAYTGPSKMSNEIKENNVISNINKPIG